jgi:selenocysteine-specific elongation factor
MPTIEALIREKSLLAIGTGEHRILFTAPGWDNLQEKVKTIVQDYHKRFHTRPGMPRGELSNKLQLSATVFAPTLHKLLDEGILVEEGAIVRLPSHQIQLSREQQAKVDAYLQSLSRNPYAPPSDLMPEPELLNLLIKQRRVVKVSDSVVFAASAYDEMVRKIVAHIKVHGKITLAETRDLFNTSRKYAQALLEHLDQEKITRRVGDERVLGSGST